MQRTTEENEPTAADKEELTHALCFYYSESALATTYMLHPDSQVHSTIGELFPRFITENRVLKTIPSNDYNLSIVPLVRNTDVTLKQLTRYNSNSPPLILVSNQTSPITNTITTQSELIEEQKNQIAHLNFEYLLLDQPAQNLEEKSSYKPLPKAPVEFNAVSLDKWIVDASGILNGWRAANNASKKDEAHAVRAADSARQEAASARQEAASARQEAASARQEACAIEKKLLKQINRALEAAASAQQEAASARQEGKQMRKEMLETKAKNDRNQEALAPLYLLSLIDAYLLDSIKIMIPNIDDKSQTLGSFLKFATSEELKGFDELLEKKASIIRVHDLESREVQQIWRKRIKAAHSPPRLESDMQDALKISGLHQHTVFQKMVECMYDGGYLILQ